MEEPMLHMYRQSCTDRFHIVAGGVRRRSRARVMTIAEFAVAVQSTVRYQITAVL